MRSFNKSGKRTGKNETRLIVLFLMIFLSIAAVSETYGQQGVGISESAITPDASSILELRSTNKGFLVPRLNRAAIASPVQGLLVFDTGTNSFWYYDNGWKEIASTSAAASSAEDYLLSPVSLTANISSFSPALASITLAAGTWMITSETTIAYGSGNTTWHAIVVLGTSPTSVYTSGQGNATTSPPLTSAVTISLSKIVTLTSTTTVSVFAAANVAATVVTSPPANPSTSGPATAIHAVRIK